MRWNYSCERKNGNTKEPCVGGVLGCPYKFNCKTSTVVGYFLQLHGSFNVNLQRQDGKDLGGLLYGRAGGALLQGG